MAHFAEVGSDNIVIRVVVIANDEILDGDGVESEDVGAARCLELFGDNGTTWVQTSYNANFRKRYAGIGLCWDADNDAFHGAQPFDSWTYNTETSDWDPPTLPPSTTTTFGEGETAVEVVDSYDWNEDTLSWDKVLSG